MRKTLVILLSLCALSVYTAAAQFTMVKDGKPTSRIVIQKGKTVDAEAAALLQNFVRRISGATLPIVDNAKTGSGDIVISDATDAALKTDGFRIKVSGDGIVITGGGHKGTLYGVVTLVDDYMGVDYYSKETYTLTPSPTITIAAMDRVDNPAFVYRQMAAYASADPIYKVWYRLEEPKDIFAGGWWVHTFNGLLPSAVYGKDHPEYYSMINGRREVGESSQWCLSNPEVFEIVSSRIDSIFRANPEQTMISVSNNDSDNTNCTCEECKKLDDMYGGVPSGSLIWFMNKLATRFPDKQFSTLAYIFTRRAPKNIRPLPNVNIMLCNIECTREASLEDTDNGRIFMKDMKDWAAISDNIFFWDYVGDFDNEITPFPSYHFLQRNLQLFKEHNVTMMHEQRPGNKGADFSDMKAYLLSKLMWDPYQNYDSLMRTFMDGFYGAAAPYMYEYLKLQEGGLIASGINLTMNNDNPAKHITGFCRPLLMRRYAELFDAAERAVSSDKTLLGHVQLARLPLQYAELEIARVNPDADIADIKAKLELFRRRAAEQGVTTLNRLGTCHDYCDIYAQRYLPRAEKSLASGAKIEWITPPSERFKVLGETELTNGSFGGSAYSAGWVGWDGCDVSFIVDLGSEMDIESVSTDFLHQQIRWVFMPRQVKYSVSSDGKSYADFGTVAIGESDVPKYQSRSTLFIPFEAKSETKRKARYIKVEIEAEKRCPSWHAGIGNSCWMFIDEVTVL